jgi:hypothetical protein
MAEPLTIEVRVDPAILARLQAFPEVVRRDFSGMMEDARTKAVANVTGPVLHVRTGQYRSSLTARVEPTSSGYDGVLSGARIPGQIHEYGGTILPKRGRFLVWQGTDGNLIFARRVQMPRRPHLEPALREAVPGFVSQLEADAEAITRG